jgi:flavin-dependent dehydrogenase
MTDVPATAIGWNGHTARRYDFDFRGCAEGLRGYRWVFPTLIDGVRHANVGVFALPPTSGERMRAELAAAVGDLGARADAWKAFPIRVLTPRSVVASPRALLVGDAAGAEALLGEGISFALEYGTMAGEALVAARTSGDWSFEAYSRAVLDGPIGRRLRHLWWAARLFYGPGSLPMFRLAAISGRAQLIALRWYNGVRGFEGCGPWGALRLLVSRRALEAASS